MRIIVCLWKRFCIVTTQASSDLTFLSALANGKNVHGRRRRWRESSVIERAFRHLVTKIHAIVDTTEKVVALSLTPKKGENIVEAEHCSMKSISSPSPPTRFMTPPLSKASSPDRNSSEAQRYATASLSQLFLAAMQLVSAIIGINRRRVLAV
ncbi:hypothetical protein J2D73_09300 [Acetobacter sacchari]|uniref:Transposase n=1 Tax=Acetobacter sacchari TaxID=2661687 RepID=A0ABS3LVP6_9PROT|nr:hypothetical protein [Acetobacter sacchari]